MTSNIRIGGFGPEPGASRALHRMLDVLREAGPAGTARLAHPAGAGRSGATSGPELSGTESSRQSVGVRGAAAEAMGAGARTTDLARLLSAHGAMSRLAPAALAAHAAVGELDVRRAAFAAVERTLADGARAVRGPIETLQRVLDSAATGSGSPGDLEGAGDDGSRGAGSAGPGQARSTTAGSSEVARSESPQGAVSTSAAQREVSARTAVTVREGAGALARAADRLDTLRLEAEAAVRATAAQVDALSQEVAAADRRARSQERSQARLDSERAEIRAALTRRDAAAREIVRLTGASVQVPSPGEVELADLPAARGAGATGSPGATASPTSSATSSATAGAGESGEREAMRITLAGRPLVDEQGAHSLLDRLGPGSGTTAGPDASAGAAGRGARADQAAADRAATERAAEERAAEERRTADRRDRGEQSETGPIDRRALQSAAERLAMAHVDDGDPSARAVRERRLSDREAQQRIDDRRAVREQVRADVGVTGGDRPDAAASAAPSRADARDAEAGSRAVRSSSDPAQDAARARQEARAAELTAAAGASAASRETRRESRGEDAGAERVARLHDRDSRDRAADAREEARATARHTAGTDAADDAERLVRKALARIDAQQAAAAVADLRDAQRADAEQADAVRATSPQVRGAVPESAEGRRAVSTPGASTGPGVDRIEADPIESVAGALAGRLAAAERIVPAAQEQLRAATQAYVRVVEALTAPGGPLAGHDLTDLVGRLGGAALSGGGASGAGAPGMAGPAAEAAPRPAPEVAGVLTTIESARAQAGDQALLAQRRLDVLSVVDSVLADAPTSQAGGLVSAALGGAALSTSGAGQTSQSGQHLVSSLQSLNALTASLGAVAGLSAVVGPSAPTVSVSGSAGLVATPSASALDAAAPGRSGSASLPAGAGGTDVGGGIRSGASLGPVPGGAGSDAALLGAAGLATPAGVDGAGALRGSWTSGPGVRVALLAPPTPASPEGATPEGATPGSPAMGSAGTGPTGAPVVGDGIGTGAVDGLTSASAAAVGGPGAGQPRLGSAGPDAVSSAGAVGGAPFDGDGASGSGTAGVAPTGVLTAMSAVLGPNALAGTGTTETGGAGVAPTAAPGELGEPAWGGPRIPYDVSVSVVSVAAAAVVATAPLQTGAVLNAGRGFSFALVTHAGTRGQATTSVSVGPGARLGTVAAAINASAAPVFAQVEGLGAGSTSGEPAEQRLVISATETGSDTSIALVDGLGSRRPSVLGAVAQVQAGADSLVYASFADGAVVGVSGATTSLPGALPGVDLALCGRSGEEPGAGSSVGLGDVALVQVRADTPAALRQLTTLVDAATSVLDGLAGRGAIDPVAAAALAQDPAIADLSTRIAAVLTGSAAASDASAITGSTALGSGVSGTVSGTGPTGAIGSEGRRALPGVQLDRQARLQVDAAAFELAHAADPYAVESQVHTAARELLAVACEASDPRTGVLPVRIVGESAFVQEYAVTQVNVDERMQYRQDALLERVDAMQSLLDHLGAERQWLTTQV